MQIDPPPHYAQSLSPGELRATSVSITGIVSSDWEGWGDVRVCCVVSRPVSYLVVVPVVCLNWTRLCGNETKWKTSVRGPLPHPPPLLHPSRPAPCWPDEKQNRKRPGEKTHLNIAIVNYTDRLHSNTHSRHTHTNTNTNTHTPSTQWCIISLPPVSG